MPTPLVVILATGGTIAGAATRPGDDASYVAAQFNVAQLIAAAPALAGRPLEAEQVAQLDSKDMTHAVWQQLAQRCAHHLARPEVAGVVVTHGTDTLEETAWFLHRVLAPSKPLVLTAAMRPATSIQADGPQNLLDAVTLAGHAGARGVLACVQGRAHGPADVRKRHGSRLDAFAGGEAGPVALVEQGLVRPLRPWPEGVPLGVPAAPAAEWPAVIVLPSHAGLAAEMALALVQAAIAQGVRGLVIEGTGNGTVHRAWDGAVAAAQAAGVTVWRATRCQDGGVVGEGGLPHVAALSPAQARVELMLDKALCRTAA